MLTLSCASIYNASARTYENTSDGWCYDVDLSHGVVTSMPSDGTSRTTSLIVDAQSRTPISLFVAGEAHKHNLVRVSQLHQGRQGAGGLRRSAA